MKREKRYITGFDGIRSIAVIGVILYHLLPTSLAGGYLGVPIFFVVSGYLITDLLLQEFDDNKKIDIWAFYKRRMKRLYPAMVGMFLTAITYITLFQQNLLENIRQIVVSSLLYVNNWWQISRGFSYFDRFANESPFTHIWSLAVEGQNYLIWPIVVLLMLKFIKSRGRIFYILMGASIFSALLMVILYTPGGDPTRVYYGTDTRLFSVLIGSALSFVWPSRRLKKNISRKATWNLNVIGLISLIILLIGLVKLDDQSNFVYWGGMYLYSIFCAILVAVTAHPGSSWNRWLTNPIFNWLGKRSYGIYLYQYPVMIFYEAKITNVNNLLWLHIIIEIVLILLVSELSYRFIETPFRKLDYGHLKQQMANFLKSRKSVKQTLFYSSSILLLAITVFGLLIAPTDAANAEQDEFEAHLTENSRLAEATKDGTTSSTDSSTDSTAQSEIPTEANPYGLSEAQITAAQALPISAFGDSIVLDMVTDFQSVFPQIVIDGEVGRQLYNSSEALSGMADKGELADTVIMSLGTNGPFTEEQFAEIMTVLGERQVYWINLHLPTRRWETQVNDMLTAMDAKYDNLTLIDWHTYSTDHPEWFFNDNVHPNAAGAVEYTRLVAQAILAE
ncbi:acyltransferase family protein [Enterococcus sp. HY326]|uniref:acyltransferase family protein n=1 Tax=Enterococcus sp. HY326 TaxID=2971265 RepID=UPI00223F0EF1|nr:acyltransferase family protein [Enterococcus sp. HY326]